VRSVVAILVVVLSARVAVCGDYLLVIANDRDSACVKRLPRIALTIRSGADVAEELGRYFRGADESSTLVSMFPNGHFRFCGRGERGAMYEALLDAASLSAPRHEEQLYLLMDYLATRRFIAAIDRRLAAPAIGPPVRARMERMRARGLSALGEGS
jgi:hypothetical protein